MGKWRGRDGDSDSGGGGGGGGGGGLLVALLVDAFPFCVVESSDHDAHVD